ncbi:MAG: 30S ribosomal protein S17 [Patescibacteria group bacterium]|nr:30S ribosomal protein S17 [Patescibacteria group bacterium]
MNQKNRVQKSGVVISRSGLHTVVVRVDTYVAHPLYKKRVRKTKRFVVHDEKDTTNVGDTIVIAETRPISKTKHWEVTNIIKTAAVKVTS